MESPRPLVVHFTLKPRLSRLSTMANNPGSCGNQHTRGSTGFRHVTLIHRSEPTFKEAWVRCSCLLLEFVQMVSTAAPHKPDFLQHSPHLWSPYSAVRASRPGPNIICRNSTASRLRPPCRQCACVGPGLWPPPAPYIRKTRQPRTAGYLLRSLKCWDRTVHHSAVRNYYIGFTRRSRSPTVLTAMIQYPREPVVVTGKREALTVLGI